MKIKFLFALRAVVIFVPLIAISTGSFSQTYIVEVKAGKWGFGYDNGKWGYANNKGELIIPCKFDKSYPFSESGLAIVYAPATREYYFINTKGEKLRTDVQHFRVEDIMGFVVKGYHDGIVSIKVRDKDWGYMDKDGHMITDPKYDQLLAFNGGYGVGKRGGRFVILNRRGEETLTDKSVDDMAHFSEGLAPFKVNGKYGFMDHEAKIVIPCQYGAVGYFIGGVAWARSSENGLHGYINPAGEWLVKPQFEGAKDIDPVCGLARVKNHDEWSYVNTTGTLVHFDSTGVFNDFADGVARGKKNGKWGFYDSKGVWVIPPTFDGARDFKNGFASVKMDGKWGAIDLKGVWVLPANYASIQDMEKID